MKIIVCTIIHPWRPQNGAVHEQLLGYGVSASSKMNLVGGEMQEKTYKKLSITIGVVIAGLVAVLLLAPLPSGIKGSVDVSGLPLVNASLNAFSLVALTIALIAIKRDHVAIHKAAILSAVASSAGFLVSYVTYHTFKPAPRPYVGEYPDIYYPLLTSHILLAVLIVPFVLVTLRRGLRMERETHKKIARITMPLWLYVSITGIIIFFMLH
jgi:putative membrane protein